MSFTKNSCSGLSKKAVLNNIPIDYSQIYHSVDVRSQGDHKDVKGRCRTVGRLRVMSIG